MKKVQTLIMIVVCACFLSSCASIVKTKTTTTTYDGENKTVIEAKSYARQPKYPLGGAMAMSTTNGITEASTSGSQDKAGIDREKWKGLNQIAVTIMCGLLALFGAAILFAGEKLGLSRKECNRDGAICIGAGLGMFAVMNWVDASAPVMKWAIPVVFIALIGFYGYMYWKKRKTPNLLDAIQS